MIKKMTFPLALVVAAAFSAHPALAQHGNGHGHGNGGEHGHGNGRGDEVRAERGDRDDDDDDRVENRRVRDDDWLFEKFKDSCNV